MPPKTNSASIKTERMASHTLCSVISYRTWITILFLWLAPSVEFPFSGTEPKKVRIYYIIRWTIKTYRWAHGSCGSDVILDNWNKDKKIKKWWLCRLFGRVLSWNMYVFGEIDEKGLFLFNQCNLFLNIITNNIVFGFLTDRFVLTDPICCLSRVRATINSTIYWCNAVDIALMTHFVRYEGHKTPCKHYQYQNKSRCRHKIILTYEKLIAQILFVLK